MGKQIQAVTIEEAPTYEIEFSFCSLVTNTEQYQEMLSSLKNAGFDESCAEFLCIDNTEENVGDGFSGLNRLANFACGRFVVFCHQDLLVIDGPDALRQALAKLDDLDPNWALASNAGASEGSRYYYLNEPGHVFAGKARKEPIEVTSVDENLIVMRQDARLGFSADLAGFHLYGTDLVVQANIRGLTAYVIDFRVEHVSSGKIDQRFFDACISFEAKYAEALKPRQVQTTCTLLDLGAKQGVARRRRERNFERESDFVRPSRKIRKAFRSWASSCSVELEGLRFTYPWDVSYATYLALRKGYYRLPERNFIAKYLPDDLPVVELGAGYGILSGLINEKINKDMRQIIVEADTDLFKLCKSNVRSGGGERDIKALNYAIGYSETDNGSSSPVSRSLENSVVSSRQSGLTADAFSVSTKSLSQVLEDENLAGPYSLVCDIDGVEFDLITKDQSGLEQCKIMIARLCPSAYYENGQTQVSLFRSLDAAGFEVLESEACVLVAGRRQSP